MMMIHPSHTTKRGHHAQWLSRLTSPGRGRLVLQPCTRTALVAVSPSIPTLRRSTLVTVLSCPHARVDDQGVHVTIQQHKGFPIQTNKCFCRSTINFLEIIPPPPRCTSAIGILKSSQRHNARSLPPQKTTSDAKEAGSDCGLQDAGTDGLPLGELRLCQP